MDTATEVAVVVRFSNDLPDLRLTQVDISSLALSLKLRIRDALPGDEASHCLLRLIHGGKMLQDGYPLSAYLRGADPYTTVFLSCSIGEPLSTEELGQERDDEVKLKTKGHVLEALPTLQTFRAQGFDRLLGQGFTTEDIRELRAGFLTNLARSTNNLPEGETLRRLEDDWLDLGAYEPSESLNDANDVVDEVVLGFVTGLVWPVALIITARDTTVWSEWRRNGVMMGVVTNAMVGLLRLMSSQAPGT